MGYAVRLCRTRCTTDALLDCKHSSASGFRVLKNSKAPVAPCLTHYAKLNSGAVAALVLEHRKFARQAPRHLRRYLGESCKRVVLQDTRRPKTCSPTSKADADNIIQWTRLENNSRCRGSFEVQKKWCKCVKREFESR